MLTSRRSPRVVRARSLHERKGRRAERAFLIEGPTLVGEALRSPVTLQELFHVEALSPVERELVEEARARGIGVTAVSPDVLAAVSQARTPQSLAAVADIPVARAFAEVAVGARMIVGLDRVADPGNVGTVVRTAEAAGAQGIVLIGPCADPWSPKAVRASAGALLRVPVVSLAAPQVLAAAGAAGLDVIATVVSGDTAPWDAVAHGGPGVLWLFGSEAHGLDAAFVSGARSRVRIPMAGAVESLNLAASVAVCLFAQVRRRMTD